MDKDNIVGKITQKVIDTFNLRLAEGQPIFCGQSNKDHMKNEHPEDFEKYGDKIEEIIENPDFIAKHPQKDSIEYIKIYKDNNNDHVLVAVRATGAGTLFARTLFVMDSSKVNRYVSKNALKAYK